MMKKDKMYRRLMSMDGYIFVQIRDDKIDVWGNEFLLGELTVSMMNTPETVMLELLTLTSDLKRLPLNSFHMYPLVPCEPPRSKLAPRRVPTVDDLKKAQKHLTIASKLLSSIEVGSLVTRFYPLPQTDLDKLRNVDRRSKQFKEILTDYVVCYNNYLLAANDIIAMYEYIRDYVSHSMLYSDSLDVSSLSKTYQYVMSKDGTGWEIDRLLEALEGEYRLGDQIILQYVPMKKENSDDWMISELFRFDTLQGFFRTDFVRGLMKGHFPRKCAHCGRYFLMTRAYQTKYCDMPSPEDPTMTCRQAAYKKVRDKERSKDDPKYQSYQRCRKRINTAFTRGSIGEKEKALLLSTLEDLYFEACSSPKYSNEEFEQLLDSERLYKLCGLEYKGRGRPRSVRRTKDVKRTQNEQSKPHSCAV
jgi:hypothetical protein